MFQYCCLITSSQLWAKAKRCVSLNSITHWIIWISHGICLNAIGPTMTDWHSKHVVSFVCLFSTSTSKFFFKRTRSQLAPGHQPATRLLVFTLVGCLLGAGDIAQCQWSHWQSAWMTLRLRCENYVVINTGLSHCVLFFLQGRPN